MSPEPPKRSGICTSNHKNVICVCLFQYPHYGPDRSENEKMEHSRFRLLTLF